MAEIFGIQFYPTPPELVQKMLSKVDFENVTYVLEPSAGKGDIVDGIRQYLKDHRHTYSVVLKQKGIKPDYKTFSNEPECIRYVNNKYQSNFTTRQEITKFFCDKADSDDTDNVECEIYKSDSALSKRFIEIEAIEIDTDLQAVLRNKKITVVGDDFAKYDGCARYDLILMNPPFKDGDKHLLKALQMISNGGQCVCILNAETLRNPYTDTRQYLCNLLDRYNADIEYMSRTFSNAENSTDVDIAIVYVNIPRKEIELDAFKNLVLGENYDKKYDGYDDTQLATNDFISNVVKQYEFEAKAGLKIIDTFYSMAKYIPIVKDSNEIKMISLSVCGCPDETQRDVKHSPANTYIRHLRDKYWSILFRSNEMSRLLTQTTRVSYLGKIREFRDYDFTFSNIKQVQIDLVSHLNNNIDKAILVQFDNFTYKHSLDNSTNVHYFNGWKTNDAFMVKSKVIIPMYSIYDRYGWYIYRANDFLSELEKIFVYLDGGKTEGNSYTEKISEFDRHDYNGEKISFKYFDVEFKKKGTIHIWFSNEELLKKFNIFGCQKHGWLPNSYGKKKYKDMTKEEQSVVDSFEGEKSYETTTMTNPSYYLSGNQMLQIETTN